MDPVSQAAGLVARRLLVVLPTLVLLSMGVFVLADHSPLDPLVGYLGDRYQYASPADQARLAEAMGLGHGWWPGWTSWAGGLLHGDLGLSRSLRQPVATVITERLPWTLVLSSVALVLATVAGLAGGVLSALHPGSWLDRAVEATAVVAQSVPPFVLALVLVLVGSLTLGWFPAGGAVDVRGGGGALDVAHHLVLPTLVLGASQVPWLLLSLRTQVDEALASDAVRAAVVRGVPWSTVVRGHVLPVSLAPMVTLLGARLPELVVGAAIVEEVFAWPGLAAAMVTAARQLDLPLLVVLTLLSTALVLLGSLLADLAYLRLDPRVRADG